MRACLVRDGPGSGGTTDGTGVEHRKASGTELPGIACVDALSRGWVYEELLELAGEGRGHSPGQWKELASCGTQCRALGTLIGYRFIFIFIKNQ